MRAVKEPTTATILRPQDRAELIAIAEKQQRTVSWILAEIVRRTLEDPELNAWLHANPVLAPPMAISLSAVDRSKLEVLARACQKSVATNASDILNASLDFPSVKIALVTQSRKQLAADPTFQPAQTVLKSFGLSLVPPAAAATTAPAPTSTPTPAAPAPAEVEAEPEALTADVKFAADGQPQFDLSYLAPPSSTPSQKPVATIAGVQKKEETQ